MARRRPHSDKSHAVCPRPVPGTAYWTCPNRECLEPNSRRRSRWPLRIVIRSTPLLTGKTAICSRCQARRTMSKAERQLISGNPDRPDALGVMPLLKRHAATLAKSLYNVSKDDVMSQANDVACLAAMTFDPKNGFQFSTYLVSRLRQSLTRRSIIREIYPDQKQQIPLPPPGRFPTETLIQPEADEPEFDSATNDRLMDQAGLSEEERQLIRERWGLSGTAQLTLGEMARIRNLSRYDLTKRVKEIESRMKQRCTYPAFTD